MMEAKFSCTLRTVEWAIDAIEKSGYNMPAYTIVEEHGDAVIVESTEHYIMSLVGQLASMGENCLLTVTPTKDRIMRKSIDQLKAENHEVDAAIKYGDIWKENDTWAVDVTTSKCDFSTITGVAAVILERNGYKIKYY